MSCPWTSSQIWLFLTCHNVFYDKKVSTANQPYFLLLPPGAAYSDEAEHHAGETRPDVRRSSSLRARRLTQHSEDSCPHAAGWLPAARQRAHARRSAALSSQLSACGRSSASTQPPQQGLEPWPPGDSLPLKILILELKVSFYTRSLKVDHSFIFWVEKSASSRLTALLFLNSITEISFSCLVVERIQFLPLTA